MPTRRFLPKASERFKVSQQPSMLIPQPCHNFTRLGLSPTLSPKEDWTRTWTTRKPRSYRASSVLRLGSPDVLVIKGDGSISLCGDYKVTVLLWTRLSSKIATIFRESRISFCHCLGEKSFWSSTCLAYQQVQLDEASRQYVTINEHKGLFYNRVPFGISSAPPIF